jgi:integrase
MCWCDIDQDRSVVHLPVTKNGHTRTIPLTQKSKQVLATIEQIPPAQEVFQTSSETIKRSWKRAIERAGISDFHFYDLRHEAVSRFFELGLSIPEVALISGHRDTRMLFRYTHLKPEDVGTKVARLHLAALT